MGKLGICFLLLLGSHQGLQKYLFQWKSRSGKIVAVDEITVVHLSLI